MNDILKFLKQNLYPRQECKLVFLKCKKKKKKKEEEEELTESSELFGS